MRVWRKLGVVSMLRVGNNMLTLNAGKKLIAIYYQDTHRLIVRSGYSATRCKFFMELPQRARVDETHRHTTDAAMQRYVLKEINKAVDTEHGIFIKRLYNATVAEGVILQFTQTELTDDPI